MSTFILYMYICYLIAYKMLLEKAAQPRLTGRIKERTPGLISGLYNCTGIDRLDTLNIHRANAESTHNMFGIHIENADIRFS